MDEAGCQQVRPFGLKIVSKTLTQGKGSESNPWKRYDFSSLLSAGVLLVIFAGRLDGRNRLNGAQQTTNGTRRLWKLSRSSGRDEVNSVWLASIFFYGKQILESFKTPLMILSNLEEKNGWLKSWPIITLWMTPSRIITCTIKPLVLACWRWLIKTPLRQEWCWFYAGGYRSGVFGRNLHPGFFRWMHAGIY